MGLLGAWWADVRFRCSVANRGRLAPLGLLAASLSRGTLVLTSQRLAHRSAESRHKRGSLSAKFLRVAAALSYKLAIVITKSEIPSSCRIAVPVWLSQRGHLVLGATRIGRGTIIHDRVTLGGDALKNSERPSIGENVWIGRGSVIFGAVEIGDGATILPNSVVSRRVPPRAVVSGNPARILKLDYDNAPLRESSSRAELNAALEEFLGPAT